MAKVEVDGKLISKIGNGLMILIGVSEEDDGSQIEWLADKVSSLRIFSDRNEKMNLSIKDKDIDGEILLVPQFTLCGKTKKGRRPDFTSAAKPQEAEKLYLQFAEKLEQKNIKPKLGCFGKHMKVSLENDGPVTIIIER